MSSIRPFGCYVLRKPLLPIDVLSGLLNRTTAVNALESDLRALYRRQDLQEAIYHASPQLYHRLQQWLRTPDFPRKDTLHVTLLKYLIRASTRSTPYGTFAGCLSPGQIDVQTDIVFDDQRPTRKYTRLRTECLASLRVQLTQQTALSRSSLFYPNDSLYRWGSQYRYIFYTIEHDIRQYALCSVDVSPYLEAVLDAAAPGASVATLAEALATQDIPLSVAEDFIHTLVKEQVLMSTLQTKVTGEEALAELHNQIGQLEDSPPEVRRRLEEIQTLLTSPTIAPHHDRLAAIVQPASDHSQSITHTDLFFTTSQNTISRSVISDLNSTLDNLLVLGQGNHNPTLDHFKQQFYQRYEEQEVPLLQALDSELGIGYGKAQDQNASSVLLQEALNLSPDEAAPPVRWDYWKDFALRHYSEALSRNQSEIVLQEVDLEGLRRNHRTTTVTPATLTAWGSLLASSAAEMDQGSFQFHLRQLAGPSGVSLLGRFCHGDSALKEQVTKLLQKEEQLHPEVIFAEVVHLPNEKESVMATRPTLRRYEIPVLTCASVALENQIPLNDLMISVRQGQHLVLRSRRHNRRVIPRLSVSHNYHRGHQLYRFLGDVQFDEQALNVRWHWGVLEKQRFLPRVRYRNVILSRATWTLIAADYPALISRKTSDQQFRQILRQLPHFPRYVLWVEHDNELFIDLENHHTLKLLRKAFRKKEIITLKECLSLPSQCWLNDQAGCYAHEVIIPFVGQPTPYLGTRARPSPSTLRRTFTPGSEWLYLKLYTGAPTADKLLGTAVKELTERLLSRGLIDHWFFVRYADPEPHLRLRLHCPPEAVDQFYSVFFPAINQWTAQLQQSGQVRQVQMDTYQRELERYGSHTMEVSERLFFHDSRAVLEFLSSPSRTDEVARWQFAFGGADRLLRDFRYTLPDQARLLRMLQQAYLKEFAVTRELRRQLDTNYRVQATDTLKGLVTGYQEENPGLHRILNARSQESGDTIAEIMDRTDDRDQLVTSCVHMFLNRLFVSNPRQHELLVYYYLEKYYRSEVGRRKQCAVL